MKKKNMKKKKKKKKKKKRIKKLIRTLCEDMAMAASLPLLPPFSSSSSSSSSTGCLQVKGHRNRASIVSFLGSRDSTECNPSFSSSHGLTTTASPPLRHSLSSSSTIFHIHPLRSHEVMPSVSVSVSVSFSLSLPLSMLPIVHIYYRFTIRQQQPFHSLRKATKCRKRWNRPSCKRVESL